jgi:hypothetical protein
LFTATTGSNGQSGTFSNSTNTITVAANPSGIANPGAFTANSKLGAYTVGVTAGAATATFNLTNIVGAPAGIVVSSGSGQSANTGTAFTNPLVALVSDSGGNPVPSASVTFAGPATGAGVSFTSANPATTNASGLASINVSANGTAGGPYTVTAAVGSFITSPGFSLTNVQAQAVLTISKTAVGTFTQGSTADWDVTVGNSAATAHTTIGTVTMSDALPTGYTVSGFGTTNATTWSCGGTGTGTATCTTIVQLAGGSSYPVIHIIVNVPANSPTSPTNTASVSGGGASNSPQSASSTPTVVQVPATISINGTQTQSTADTTAFGSLAVTVKDAAGVVIPNYSPVVFTATTGSNGQSGTFSNSTNTITVAANPSGIANPGAFTANSKLGAYTVGVIAGGATATFNLTNIVGAPAGIVVSSGSGQSANTGTAFTNPLVALVSDSGGNPVPSASVTFAGPVTGAGVSFTSANPATTNASGLASVNVSANGVASGPYTVTAAVGSFITSPGFSLTNGQSTVLLTTQVSPAGGGAILPASEFVAPGTMVLVSASANTGYVFSGFSGALTGTTTPQNLTVNTAVTVTANFSPGPTSLGGGNIGLKSGPQNARVWPITIGNNGPGVALGAEIKNLVLTQTSGAACTPVVTLPAVAGTIAPGASGVANVTINFTGCPANAFFKVTETMSANSGAATGSVVKLNQAP